MHKYDVTFVALERKRAAYLFVKTLPKGKVPGCVLRLRVPRDLLNGPLSTLRPGHPLQVEYTPDRTLKAYTL